MSTDIAEDRITELNRKLDFVVEELASLRRFRESVEDLAADLSLVGKSAMRDAVEAFGTAELRPIEIMDLLKAALANAQLFERVIQQLQSATDFIDDAQPIMRDGMRRAIQAAQSMHDQGYFEAASSGLRVGNALVRAHSSEDWRQVEASVPRLIGFLRELTRPEVLEALQAIIHGFGRVQATMEVDKSVMGLLRDLNSPEARRGFAILVEFLKVVGAQALPAGSTKAG
jgi:uncharacterized protein YjgD (DUF1641 family)